MGERLDKKFERIEQLKQLLLEHPEGLSRAEIARRLGVHRSTAGEYIDELSRPPTPFVHETAPDLFAIDRDRHKIDVQLTLHESMMVHLAARLFATRTDKHNPHAASALRILSLALEKFAPLISQHLSLSADVLDDDSRRRDPVFMQVLETLTRAWSLGKKVHLTHESDNERIYDYDFAPYFIEPYAIGRTAHVIGWCDQIAKTVTFKIERIRTIQLLEVPYSIPKDFDPREKLKDAWGIWYTDKEPEKVVLHFSRQVARRVLETKWHHSEETKEQSDGSLLWQAQVAEWKEMENWIRGWGAEVEVLEPKELRAEVMRETRRLLQLYRLSNDEQNLDPSSPDFDDLRAQSLFRK
jgi:CRISPR-associated endonuclease/helicase Cas3